MDFLADNECLWKTLAAFYRDRHKRKKVLSQIVAEMQGTGRPTTLIIAVYGGVGLLGYMSEV